MNLAASLVKINDIKNGDNTKVNDAENNVDEEVAEKIMKVESDLDNLKNKLDRQNGFKYWAIAFFTILDFILFFWQESQLPKNLQVIGDKYFILASFFIVTSSLKPLILENNSNNIFLPKSGSLCVFKLPSRPHNIFRSLLPKPF